MTNATSKPAVEKTADSKPAVESPKPAETSQATTPSVAPVVETTPTTESATPEVKPAVDHSWRADILRKAYNDSSDLVVASRWNTASRFQSNMVAIIGDDTMMVYRAKKSAPKPPTKPGAKPGDDPVIDTESPKYAEYVTLQAEYDRTSMLVDKFGKWYFDHPVKISDDSATNDALMSLLNNGRNIAIANFLIGAIIGSGVADTVMAYHLAQNIKSGKADQIALLESDIKRLNLDPNKEKQTASLENVNLIKLVDQIIANYELVKDMLGINGKDKPAAKSDTPKVDDSDLLGLALGAIAKETAKVEAKASPSQGKGSRQSNPTPTGKEYNPADNLKAASQVADAVNAKENAVNGTPSAPTLIKSEGEHNGVKVESTPPAESAKSESPAENKDKPTETKTDSK